MSEEKIKCTNFNLLKVFRHTKENLTSFFLTKTMLCFLRKFTTYTFWQWFGKCLKESIFLFVLFLFSAWKISESHRSSSLYSICSRRCSCLCHLSLSSKWLKCQEGFSVTQRPKQNSNKDLVLCNAGGVVEL